MDFGYSLTVSAIALGALVQLAFLWLQVGAVRRHGHDCFRVLILGSLCGVVYTATAILPYVLTLPAQTMVIVYSAGTLALFPTYILSLVGSIMLFRSYRQLAERSEKAAVDA